MKAPGELAARRAATAVLKEAGVVALPVDPSAIASGKRVPIPIVEASLPVGIYGACGFVEGRFTIAISTTCPTEGHRRFTIAHELGHYHLDGHLEAMFQSGGNEWVNSVGSHFHGPANRVEREADFFASELLMPESLLRSLTTDAPSLSLVRRISDTCAVSLSAAAIAMTRLSKEPVAVLVSKNGILEWPSYSAALNDYPWTTLRAKGEWVPPKSCTKRLAGDLTGVRAGLALEGDGLLCEWFPKAPNWVHVAEDAIGLGNYGRVLTVLRIGQLPDPDEEQERSWKGQREEWANDS